MYYWFLKILEIKFIYIDNNYWYCIINFIVFLLNKRLFCIKSLKNIKINFIKFCKGR